MTMPLNADERRYFDEKFNNIDDKIDSVLDLVPRVNTLEREMEKRPTLTEIIMACGFFLVLGVTLGAALF